MMGRTRMKENQIPQKDPAPTPTKTPSTKTKTITGDIITKDDQRFIQGNNKNLVTIKTTAEKIHQKTRVGQETNQSQNKEEEKTIKESHKKTTTPERKDRRKNKNRKLQIHIHSNQQKHTNKK